MVGRIAGKPENTVPAAGSGAGASDPDAVDQPHRQHYQRPAIGRWSGHAQPRRLPDRPVADCYEATDLIERSKAELNAASRRQMLDPMFAPAARHTSAKTPLERATARAETKIEELGPALFRVTSADGSHYCLQRLPEIATRDIPGPLVGVPMKCQ